MKIGEMAARMVERTPPRDPDGGIGTLTPAEDAQLTDLLNSEPPCECGVCGCNNPIWEPGRRPGG